MRFCSLDVSFVKVGASVPHFRNVLKRMWKKAVSKLNSVYCHEICMEGLRRSNRISARVAIFWSSSVIQEESAPEGDPGCVGKMEWRKM